MPDIGWNPDWQVSDGCVASAAFHIVSELRQQCAPLGLSTLSFNLLKDAATNGFEERE